jgi:hypothetical protein
MGCTIRIDPPITGRVEDLNYLEHRRQVTPDLEILSSYHRLVAATAHTPGNVALFLHLQRKAISRNNSGESESWTRPKTVDRYVMIDGNCSLQLRIEEFETRSKSHHLLMERCLATVSMILVRG